MKFAHPIDTHEGRIERATVTLLDARAARMPVAQICEFLKRKGCSDDEIAEALNRASSGALLEAALG